VTSSSCRSPPDNGFETHRLEINWFLGDQAEEDPEHMEDIFDLLLGRLGRWDPAEVPPELLAYEERRTGRSWAYRHPTTAKPIPPPYAMLASNPGWHLLRRAAGRKAVQAEPDDSLTLRGTAPSMVGRLGTRVTASVNSGGTSSSKSSAG
jgi:hypothetical protein